MLNTKPTALLLAGALALAPFVAQAEAEVARQVLVTGEASMDVPPDQAVVTMGVRAQDPQAAEAMAQVSEGMSAILASLRDSGIAAEDMQTRQISLHPVWSETRYDSGKTGEVTGFEASNQLIVTLHDLEAMGGVLDEVLRAGANEFQGLSFSYSDMTGAQDVMRTEAVEDAIRKAQQLAEASGMVLGPVREIRDSGAGGGAPMRAMEMARVSDMAIAPGSVNLTYAVSVSFDLLAPADEQ
ncbi:SIMPL domain-containing protein [Phaeobacter sp. HF9A]|uniref:SIMPL domain-containing protein n=1 Tax=Phaeobacter sp. HF9A TaxID=2721561 RepID=UPI001430F61F|nr:SIMPL domain-containing protein [Phaeobacter sp. HF9A]NIZ13792.1 SIMPL domain-containing protein [Phaeobacter sp. HF9A]